MAGACQPLRELGRGQGDKCDRAGRTGGQRGQNDGIGNHEQARAFDPYAQLAGQVVTHFRHVQGAGRPENGRD